MGGVSGNARILVKNGFVLVCQHVSRLGKDVLRSFDVTASIGNVLPLKKFKQLFLLL